MRPKYHQSIFSIINSFTRIDESTNILEIGCGTGQATEQLIDSKAKIKCLDIGQNMIDVCRKKFCDYNNVSFYNMPFEEYQTSEKYDLIYSATAYHWIKQPEGDLLTANLLRENGVFALFRTYNIGKDDPFFIQSQSIYNRYMGKKDANEKENHKILNTTVFEKICNYEYFWNEDYKVDDYLKLVSTYSDHIALGENQLSGLLNELGKLIETEFNGKVRKKYMTVLEIGKKKLEN
jgi:Predicted methyltransferase (contains TPR repeat)